MTFKEWIIKNFKKKRAVVVYFVHEDGHFTKHWTIPAHDYTVKLDGVEKAAVIKRETAYLSEGNVPTFVVHHSNCETINLDDQRESYFDAKEMRLILDNDEAHKVFQASRKGALSNEVVIIIGAILIGFAAMFYFTHTKIEEIKDRLPAPVVEVVENE